MRATCGNWARRAVRAAGVGAALAATCAPAHAFYWYDWPGSRVNPPPSLLGPSQQPGPESAPLIGPITPSVPGTGKVPDRPGGGGPPLAPPGEWPPLGPVSTPEPSTGLIGLIGLGAAAAARKWRARN